MSFFDLDPVATQNLMDRAAMSPVDPESLKPGWFAGTWKAPVTGLASVVNDAALLAGDAATPMLRPYARAVDQLFKTNVDDWLVREQQKAVDNIKEWAPDPRTSGVVAQAVHGLFNIGPEAIAGGPTVAAALQGYKGFRGGMAEGLDPGTAFGKGAIDGISTWVGLKIPMTLAPTLGPAGNVIGAGVANVATGMTSRGVTAKWLESQGYPEMASQYQVLDATAIAMDLIMGGGFGALYHYGPGVVAKYDAWKKGNESKILPSDRDTAMYLNAALHAELDTAPGIPTDPTARAAHVEALTKALQDLMAGREVTAPDGVTQANFIDNPSAMATRAEVRAAVEAHLGPEWAQMQVELASRGLPTDPNLYSRGDGQGMTVESLTMAVRQAAPEAAALVDSGRVQMVETPDALPPRADGQAHPPDARGYFDGERFYLVAKNLDPTQIRGVMVHEVGAHYGMERLLGPELYGKILQEVTDRAKAGEADFAQAMRDVPMDTPQADVGKETLAYLVENRPDLPLVKRILSEIKTAIYRLLGGRFITLNADDLRTMAVAAVRRVSSAEMAAMRGEPVELYARAKPGVESPGVGVAPENLNGFEPDLRVMVPGRVNLPAKPLILTGTNAKNAARQIAAIDDILARHPDADSSPLEWSRMMAYAMASKDVPIPPYRFLSDINSDGALRGLQRLTQGQIDDANHGFENARAFREAYTDGTMTVEDTGKLFMWSFLSRGVSPYTQEGLFIDAFPGIGPWIKKAADGQLTEADFPAYEAWAKSVAPQGSGQPGSGATHNLNAFGRLFLFKMGQRGEDGVSRLQKLHDLMADPNQTGPAIRRWFIENAEGVGIDNKVVSFTLLVAGFPDVMVLDRVQIRQLWDDGRFGDRNLYDGRKQDGKPVAGSMLSELTYGARGLLIYEAIERALAKRVENIYTLLGRPEDASIGRYHWETWVADSAQEASHGTLDAILSSAKGDAEAMVGVTAKEGEYGGYAYGARYGRDAAGMPYFQYTTPGGKDLQFTVPAFREFLTAVKSPKNRVVPTGFKVTEAGNAPWFERPEVNRQALDELAERYASGSDGRAAAGEGAGAVPEARPGQAVPDQPGRGGDAFGPDYVVANNPALTIPSADGTMIPAAKALADADAEIAKAQQDSQGYEAAVACALRG